MEEFWRIIGLGSLPDFRASPCAQLGTRRKVRRQWPRANTRRQHLVRRVLHVRRVFSLRHTAQMNFAVCPLFRTRRIRVHTTNYQFPVVNVLINLCSLSRVLWFWKNKPRMAFNTAKSAAYPKKKLFEAMVINSSVFFPSYSHF